ncbi:unnamed protein product [Clavelina lepadiformis]|uniref:GST N-terminal domain-containing protein n=2 Tax=Clavelina lepadiformis TaxID=159417 RepID=A0ABP0GGM7_CLALP
MAKIYQLIGAELSPYTAKVRLYLRYKRIPFEPVQSTVEVYLRFIKPRVGQYIVPVLVTPDKQVIQDSAEMISFFEERYPLPPVIPKTSKQKIVSSLLEMFADEWLFRPILHYRWSYPENLPFLKEEFGRVAFPTLGTKERSDLAENVYGRYKNLLPLLGITKKTGPAFEESWKEMLDELTAHFDKHPYFLGGKPCVGDFAFAGMAYTNFFRDPIPGYLMKTRAPLVAAWVENMNGHLPHANKLSLHEVTEDGWLMREDLPEESRDFCANDYIPETLFPILTRFFTEFGPILLSTKSYLEKYIKENITADKTELPRSIGEQEFTLRGVTEVTGIFPFYVWKWQRVVDLYNSLPFCERQAVDNLMVQFPYGLQILKVNLNQCRVQRINNILHAVKQVKSHL